MPRPNWLSEFRFSLSMTVASAVLAAVMFWAATWQWERYHEKTALIATYQADAAVTPLPFPKVAASKDEYLRLRDRRVRLRGRYDFDHQVIVTNRMHRSGAGHLLLTPLQIEGTDLHVIVSRGFIPFEDRAPDTWRKYNIAEHEELDAVVKQSAEQRSFGPRNPAVGDGAEFASIFFFPEISKITKQLPYKVISDIYLQRLGNPPVGEFPAESILVEVPPSTHYGYSIEWCLLGLATLTIGFLLQAFPRKKRAGAGMPIPDYNGAPPRPDLLQ